MSTHVRGVSEVATQLTDLNKKASKIAQDLNTHISEANEALEVASEVGESLKKAAAELRATLGMTSNRPPE